MFRILTLLIALFVVGLSTDVQAQDAGPEAQALAAALDKNKYKKKEKRDIKIEIYIDIKNVPVVKSSAADYSGVYESDNDYSLELKVGADGSAEGSGYDAIHTGEDSAKKRFTLKSGRVDGAVLSATKVFENGETEKFKAVFAERTVLSGKNADSIATRDVSFGLGFIQAQKDWSNRVFLEKQD
jgi:hypothetical protein